MPTNVPTHIAVGTSTTAFTAALTTLLSGWRGFDTAHAAAAAALIVMIGGGIYALAAWWVGWKYPTIPPLPRNIS